MNKMIECYKQALGQYSNRASFGLLVLRIIAGAAFMQHGWMKIQHPFGWMPEGSPVPGFFQFLAAFSEFGGGLAWILGLLCPVASLGIIITMIVAVAFHASQGAAWISHEGSFELPLLYLAVAIVILLGGPGKFSLDRKIVK